MAKGNDRRLHEPRHVRLYHSITGSPAWLDLSGNAVKLLVALARLDKGGDNGKLFMSARVAAEAIGVRPNTAARAFRELEDHGFIRAIERGHFTVKGGTATVWRLTWAAAPGIGGPTRDFEKWEPVGNKTRYRKLSATVSKNDTVSGNTAATVSKSDTAKLATPLVSVEGDVSKSDTQVVCHRQGGTSGDFQGRKQANPGSGPFLALASEGELDRLRASVADYLAGAGVGAQSRLAEASGIGGGTLSKFIAGRGLPVAHVVNLQIALTAAQRKAA